MNDNLADMVINQIERDRDKEKFDEHPNQWGIDDTGFPWPNPVNAQAVAIRVFSRWGVVNGVDNIYKIDDDIFLGKRKLRQDRPTLLSLYERPNISIWANEDPAKQDEEELWRQIKKVISSEWPIVWAIIKDVAPEYSRDYIRITGDLVWGKNESDILIK